MTGTYKTKSVRPCKCGHNRWRTVGDVFDALITKYKCRKCGAIRNVTRVQVFNEKGGKENG